MSNNIKRLLKLAEKFEKLAQDPIYESANPADKYDPLNGYLPRDTSMPGPAMVPPGTPPGPDGSGNRAPSAPAASVSLPPQVAAALAKLPELKGRSEVKFDGRNLNLVFHTRGVAKTSQQLKDALSAALPGVTVSVLGETNLAPARVNYR